MRRSPTLLLVAACGRGIPDVAPIHVDAPPPADSSARDRSASPSSGVVADAPPSDAGAFDAARVCSWATRGGLVASGLCEVRREYETPAVPYDAALFRASLVIANPGPGPYLVVVVVFFVEPRLGRQPSTSGAQRAFLAGATLRDDRRVEWLGGSDALTLTSATRRSDGAYELHGALDATLRCSNVEVGLAPSDAVLHVTF